MTVHFKTGLEMRLSFPIDLFPTLAIWWNNNGYPNEDGSRRSECAFEPVPSSISRLSQAEKEGASLKTLPGEFTSWDIYWDLAQI